MQQRETMQATMERAMQCADGDDGIPDALARYARPVEPEGDWAVRIRADAQGILIVLVPARGPLHPLRVVPLDARRWAERYDLEDLAMIYLYTFDLHRGRIVRCVVEEPDTLEATEILDALRRSGAEAVCKGEWLSRERIARELGEATGDGLDTARGAVAGLEIPPDEFDERHLRTIAAALAARAGVSETAERRGS